MADSPGPVPRVEMSDPDDLPSALDAASPERSGAGRSGWPRWGCFGWGLAILFIFPALAAVMWVFGRWVWRMTAPADGDTDGVRRAKLAGRVALVGAYGALAVWLVIVVVTAPETGPDAPPEKVGPIEEPLADPADHECWNYAYDRDAWGDYPRANPGAAPRWTRPADRVNSPAITQDHHVALQDAHFSGGCLWFPARKQAFASDPDNLNPTTSSFNSSKSSRTPDRLTGIAAGVIDTDGEKCAYAFQHSAVKDEYGLTMTYSESLTVLRWLELCLPPTPAPP